MADTADAYWERKYARRSWNATNDIHFAVPLASSENRTDSAVAFDAALANSDRELCLEIEKHVGVWGFQHGLRILEIGCGTGSLARELLRKYPLSRYVGIDIAARALMDAEHLFRAEAVERWRYRLLELDARDSGALVRSLDGYAPFDVILLRECTYLFTYAEQSALFVSLAQVAGPSAHLQVQDLQCKPEALSRVTALLSARQGGGTPLTTATCDGVSWSLSDLLTSAGWCKPTIAHKADGRIAFSYRSMAALSGDKEESAFYEDLAKFALGEDLSYIRGTATRPAVAQEGLPEAGHITIAHRARRSKRDMPILIRDFSIHTGKWNLLVGVSGAGKTSILRAIAGDTSRALVVNAVPSSLFFLSAEPPVIEGATLLEHLLIYTSDKRAAVRTAGTLGLELVKLSQQASSLSSGEKQRMALAQALLTNAKCLLLDEPTQHLDPLSRLTFYSALRALRAEGRWAASSLVWVDHSADLPQDLFDAVYELRGGQVDRLR